MADIVSCLSVRRVNAVLVDEHVFAILASAKTRLPPDQRMRYVQNADGRLVERHGAGLVCSTGHGEGWFRFHVRERH